MQIWLRRRRERKQAREHLRHGTHIFNMREDLLPESDLVALRDARISLSEALKQSDHEAILAGSASLVEVNERLTPPAWRSTIREHVEILIVAVSVAMAFRAYFMQPFKIPTGSMQPTLYGIHSVAQSEPSWVDRVLPLKVMKFTITGSWYQEFRVPQSGRLTGDRKSTKDPSIHYLMIGNTAQKVPLDALRRGEIRVSRGQHLSKGDVLWSGDVIRGDHLFVNKVVWNFRKPRRGEIMVFETDGIDALPKGTHYIKRMVGLPHDAISLRPPDVLIDGDRIDAPKMITRIEEQRDGYHGYQFAENGSFDVGYLCGPDDVVELEEDQYFAMGDNTRSSRDSRYWGPVPAANLVGPAAVVYWPFSRRWGLAR